MLYTRIQQTSVCEVHDSYDLLPIYCADCPLCSDCVTREGKGLNMGMERDVIQIFLLNQGFRNLITGKSARRSCVEWRILFQNRKFRWKTTVIDLLGKLIDETECMSSDIYHEEIGENKEEEKQLMYNLHHPYQLFFFTSY